MKEAENDKGKGGKGERAQANFDLDVRRARPAFAERGATSDLQRTNKANLRENRTLKMKMTMTIISNQCVSLPISNLIVDGLISRSKESHNLNNRRIT